MEGRRYGLLGLAVSFLLSGVLLAADGRTEVPFKLYRGYTIVIQGSIGELRKLNFLIDTGAVPSVVDQRIAVKLRLAGMLDALSLFNQNARRSECSCRAWNSDPSGQKCFRRSSGTYRSSNRSSASASTP